jgi:hypothetical protein
MIFIWNIKRYVGLLFNISFLEIKVFNGSLPETEMLCPLEHRYRHVFTALSGATQAS